MRNKTMFGIEKLTTKEQITRAKVKGYEIQPFFGYLLSYMKIQEVKPEECPTMGVDAKGNCYYNKKWIDTLSESELIAVLFHETGHIAFDHLGRRGNRDPLVLNVANDAIINHMLATQSIHVPKGGIIPNQYDGTFQLPGIKNTFSVLKNKQYKSSEELYDEIYGAIPKSKSLGAGQGGKGKSKQNGNGDVGLPKGFDEHRYGNKNGKDMSDEESQNNSEKWKRVVAEAAANAKQQGKLPAGMERFVEELLDSKINWFQKLYKYVVDRVKSDYNWCLPSRRSYGIGVYLPKLIGEKVQVITSIDTSGSMSKKDLTESVSQIYSIAKSFSNIEMDIIVCDADVHQTYKVSNYTVEEIVKMALEGGGGTSHRPVYDYVKKNIPDAKVLINLTDGYTEFPRNPDKYSFDSIWVITSNGCDEKHIPFGEVIKIE